MYNTVLNCCVFCFTDSLKYINKENTVNNCKTQMMIQYRFIEVIVILLVEVLILYILTSVIDKDEIFIVL